MMGADPFLAAGDPQQALVDRLVPSPVETVAGEGMAEGLSVKLLGLGQRAVDIEDQRGGASDQLSRVRYHYGGRFCLHVRCVPPTSDHRLHRRAGQIAISFAGPKNLL